MTSQTHILNSLHRERQQMSEAAITWGDVRDLLRDCEEACALLLKDEDSNEAFDILAALENLKGIAGAMKLKNE
jgi:hypothetical protein